MTRVNLPDSLLSELRNIERRLRALETRSATPAPVSTTEPTEPSPDERE